MSDLTQTSCVIFLKAVSSQTMILCLIIVSQSRLPHDSPGTTCGAWNKAPSESSRNLILSPPPLSLHQQNGNTNSNLPQQNVLLFIVSLMLFRYFSDGVNVLGTEKYISVFLALNTNTAIKLYGLLKCKTIKSQTSLGEI